VHDLAGADALLPTVVASVLIADRGYDAEQRVLAPLRAANKVAVLPAKRQRRVQREYDHHLSTTRHLVENFFGKLKQYRASATRYDKTKRNFLAGIYLAATVITLN
jgi:transposase